MRDILLGAENLDLDIVVEGNALDFVKVLKSKMDLDVVTHPRFGTATVILPNGFKIDLVSAEVDPGIMGGIIARIGGKLIDGSTRGRLERLKEQIGEGER